jgi:hypothetical protein
MGIVKFFDKLEDHVRAWLSRRPILYGLIAGLGAVLFFRGVWMLIDATELGAWESVGISLIILLLTGAFVSHFVSNDVIMSGLKQEKKFAEQTENQMESEMATLHDIKHELKDLKNEVLKLRQEQEKEHKSRAKKKVSLKEV